MLIMSSKATMLGLHNTFPPWLSCCLAHHVLHCYHAIMLLNVRTCQPGQDLTFSLSISLSLLLPHPCCSSLLVLHFPLHARLSVRDFLPKLAAFYCVLLLASSLAILLRYSPQHSSLILTHHSICLTARVEEWPIHDWPSDAYTT